MRSRKATASAVQKNVVLLSIIAAGAAVAPSALASPTVVEADETAFRVPGAKPAIEHVPLKLTDPATKKELDPKKEYEIDGHKRTGAALSDEANAWEQHLNAYGMHLKDVDGKTVSELDVDDALEKARHDAHMASIKPVTSWQALFHSAKGRPAVKPKGLKATPRGAHAPAKPFDVSQTWAYDKSIGDNKNGGDIGGSFKVHISNAQQRAETEGHFKGYLLGNEYDLLIVNAFGEADETSPTAGASHAGVKVTSLDGKELWSKNVDSTTNPVANGKLPVFNWTGDKNWVYSMKIGPVSAHIDMALKMGMGMDVTYALDFKSARADGTPHVTGELDAKWSVDLKLVSAGVVGTVNLIKDNADFGGSAVIQESDDGSKVQLDLSVSGVNDIDALSGKISWWVKPLIGKPTGDIVKWNSVLKAKTTVFSFNQPIDVFNVPPMGTESLTLMNGKGTSFATAGSTLVPGYSAGAVIGKISPGPATGVVPLYACVYTKTENHKVKVPKAGTKPLKYEEKNVPTQVATGDHFESLDAKCEGQQSSGIIGYVWTTAGTGMKQLNRCKQGNFSTLASKCSGGAEQMHFFVQN